MGDNADNKGGSHEGIISRDLGVAGTTGQHAAHVTEDPRDVSHHRHQGLGHSSGKSSLLAPHSTRGDPDSVDQDFNRPPSSPVEGLPPSSSLHFSSGNSSTRETLRRSAEPTNLSGAKTRGSLSVATKCDQHPSQQQRGKENILPSNPPPPSKENILPSNPSFKPTPGFAAPSHSCIGAEQGNASGGGEGGGGGGGRASLQEFETPGVEAGLGALMKGTRAESSQGQTDSEPSTRTGEFRVGVDRETLLSALTHCFAKRPAPLFDKAARSTSRIENSAPKVEGEYSSQDKLSQNRQVRKNHPANSSEKLRHFSANDQVSFSESVIKTTVKSNNVIEQKSGGNNRDSGELGTEPMTDRELNSNQSKTSGPFWKQQAAQSDPCQQQPNSSSWSQQQTEGGNQCFAGQETSAEQFVQHSPKPAAVAIGTHALSLPRQSTICQESYLCGGAVSVLPPIVERAEGDVSPVSPINVAGRSDVTPAAAMPAKWTLQKVDASSRGRRVVVEPFFRKKSHDCEPQLATDDPQDSAASNGTVEEVPVPKVRKSGSHQLPPFTLRQTSLVTDNGQHPDMASKPSEKTSQKDSKNAEPKRAGSTAKNPRKLPREDSAGTSAKLSTMENPDVRIIEASPKKSAAVSGGMVYDVFMDDDDDTIRVDITGSDPPVVAAAARTISTHSSIRNSTNSPHPSVSEDDDFQEHVHAFQEWSEQKESRSLGRQDSKHALLKQDSPGGKEDKPCPDPSKQRTSSDGALFQRTRHHSMEDAVDDIKNPDQQQVMSTIGPSVSEPCCMSPARRHSLAVSLESERVRRNSVSILQARPTRTSSPNAGSASPSERVTSVPKRRHSSKQMLDKILRQEGHTSCSRKDIAASLEFLTWTHLLSTYPQSDIAATTVEKSELVVTIPVCHVSKGGSTISVTSVEAIEQTLTNFHPNLQVLLGSLSSKYDFHSPAPAAPQGLDDCSAHQGAQLSGLSSTSLPEAGRRQLVTVSMTPATDDSEAPLSPSLTEDANDEMTKLTVGSKHAGTKKRRSSNTLGPLEPEGSPRRVSINTCIRTMREGSGNYDSQLIGCRNVGTYAEEETLKVVLAKSDAISCVINAMKTFLEKEELQRQACASLLKMASASEANCAYISQNGGVTALTNTMRRYEDNADLTRQALSILGYISTTDNVKAELLGYGCHSDVLAAMSRHSDDRQTVCQCCFILGNLVISVDTAQQLMLVGGVHTIISMLKRYHDDRDILENGCRALGSFALYDETCLDVAQAGATATVVEAMKSAYSDESVLESACWALACLTSKAVTCEELVALQGVEVLVTTLESYAKEELLQEYGVRVLCNLAAKESTAGDVSTSRVVRVLMSLHQNFADNVELMECVMLAMSLVAAVDAEVQKYVLTSGGLRTVVTVMKGLEENPAIQENGCRTLGNMAVNESLRKATEQQGASQAVIAAMLNIDMCPDIQLYGCMALMNLTADLMDNKMRVKNNGAVPTLLSTLRNFPESPEVVLSALKTLGNLVDLEEACRQLLDDRGLTTIIQIAKNNRADDNIRAFAALVLSGLTVLSDLAVEDLLEIEETLVTLQAALPNDPDLALSMCQGLHNLLKSEVGLETLGQTGWMEVIENAMTTFHTHPDIHLTACRIVGTVAMEYGRCAKKSQCPLCARTVRSVLKSMRQFPAHKELQIVGCGTLSCVTETFEHLRKTIVQEGGLRDVTSAMTSFPNDDRLHSVGLIALSYLLPVDQNEVVQDGAMATEVISKSMSQFVENEDIQISACRALERCQTTDMDSVYRLLTCVHNAVRRHSGKTKVIKACRKVFTRFGGDKAEELTDEIINSPTGSPKALLTRLLRK